MFRAHNSEMHKFYVVCMFNIWLAVSIIVLLSNILISFLVVLSFAFV